MKPKAFPLHHLHRRLWHVLPPSSLKYLPWNSFSASQPLCLGLLHEEAHVSIRWVRGPGWRWQMVTLLNWVSPWQWWKNSSVWQTVGRACIGIRVITDLSKVIYEVIFTSSWCPCSQCPTVWTGMKLLQIAPEMLDERHSSLSFLPGCHHNTLSSRPLSHSQVRLKVSRWSGRV